MSLLHDCSILSRCVWTARWEVVQSDSQNFSQQSARKQRSDRLRSAELGDTMRDKNSSSIVGIVAGTGGPQAIAQVLSVLPRGFECPIIVSMALRHDLITEFVAWLGGRCALEVIVAEDEDVLKSGRVYVASGGGSWSIVDGRLRHKTGDADDRPKDSLFRAMASHSGPNTVALILTGMGRDGSDGAKAVRDAGGHTIAQDEQTSAIYSTARFAVEIDAMKEVLPLDEIGPRLKFLVEADLAKLRGDHEAKPESQSKMPGSNGVG